MIHLKKNAFRNIKTRRGTQFEPFFSFIFGGGWGVLIFPTTFEGVLTYFGIGVSQLIANNTVGSTAPATLALSYILYIGATFILTMRQT